MKQGADFSVDPLSRFARTAHPVWNVGSVYASLIRLAKLLAGNRTRR